MLTKAGADAAAILDLTEDEMREVKQLSQLFGLEELTECARIFAQNDLLQKNQGTPQLGLELASLECIEVHRRTQSGQLVPSIQLRPAISQPVAQAGGSDHLETRLPRLPQAQKSTVSKNIVESVDAAVSPVEEKKEVQPSHSQSDGSKLALTVQRVSDAWESVIKRTRQKTSPAMLSMLRSCKIIGIESRTEQTVVVVQFDKEGHYNYLKANDRYKFLEWALTTEFQIPCLVRLVPPGQLLSTVPIPDSVTYSTSAAPTIASQQSAHRGPSVLPSYPDQDTSDVGTPGSLSESNQSSREASPTDTASLARTGSMKENISVIQPQDTIEQKVRSDPVVQEVMKTFSARIVDVRPK